jgi:hypothetical protein
MTQRRSPASPAPAPWWLAGGTEECPHCGQRYHLEAERRCAGCDAPSCPHCLAHDSGLCPECATEQDE